MREKDIVENLERCPQFKRCNKNLCPLDLELKLRVGNFASRVDACRFMQERKTKKTIFKGRVLTSGTVLMPDNLLSFVPRSNIKRLNSVSRKRWEELKS